LHGLPDRNRNRVPSVGPGAGRDVEDHRQAGDLCEDDGRERNPRVQAFCGACGSPLYSTTVGEGVQPLYMLRVGILRQRDQFVPKRQIWCRSAQPWLAKIADVPKYEKQS
jgi:hypothetical protein